MERPVLLAPVEAELERDLLVGAAPFPDRHREHDGFEIEKATPFSPPSDPAQRLAQGPRRKAKS